MCVWLLQYILHAPIFVSDSRGPLQLLLVVPFILSISTEFTCSHVGYIELLYCARRHIHTYGPVLQRALHDGGGGGGKHVAM